MKQLKAWPGGLNRWGRWLGIVVLIGLPVVQAARPRGPHHSHHWRSHHWRSQDRKTTVNRLSERAQRERQEATSRAEQEGWQARGWRGNKRFQLVAIRHNMPFVLETRNLRAAVSIGIPTESPEVPFDLTGLGQVVGIWDEGDVRSTHQELSGRVELMEHFHTSRRFHFPSSHATHVAGTIGAAGVDPQAMGMAPEVLLWSYDFNNDLAEVASVAMSDPNEADHIALSNHSYGYVCGWDYSGSIPYWYGTEGEKQSFLFGWYDEESAQWDEICFNAPYYLPFRAAGNDRADKAPPEGSLYEVYVGGRQGWALQHYHGTDGPGDDGVDGGYDSMPPDGIAKNIMTVGAVQPAVRNGVRDANVAIMTSFSSWGPTNDGRIKPDVVACGVQVYSCVAGSDTDYDTYSGTSMAVASVTGGATLLTELYQQLHPDSAMLSSTLKGLLIQTADDLGRPGPDYQYGWGLVNIKAAANHLVQAAADSNRVFIREGVLDDTQAQQAWSLAADAGDTLRVTLCWTDPPSTLTDDPCDPSAVLMDDLDLRVVEPNGTVHEPFVLDPAHPAMPATEGDNQRDNVEQVLIPHLPQSGVLTLEVTYKGVLEKGSQTFSLLGSLRQTHVLRIR